MQISNALDTNGRKSDNIGVPSDIKENAMGEEEPKGRSEAERRFSEEQYEMLKRCSEKGDMTEWNEWREGHTGEEILLQGANLKGANLQGASLLRADLQGANLEKANLQEALLAHACLQGASIRGANLREAIVVHANLKEADLLGADLQKAGLARANLQKAGLRYAKLQEAILAHADLQKTELLGRCLQGANLRMAIVDGSTLIEPSEFDRFTDFTGVGLGSARMEPGIRQLLEYNIRRLGWERWYGGEGGKSWEIRVRKLVTSPVRGFWWVSDYGLSTWRIVGTFFAFTFAFALVYYACALVAAPGVVNSLLEGKEGPVASWLVPWRALYFSIVTMTTLGFGDMHANSQSFWGHLLLTLQVLLGYVLLAALVTRFAVMFMGGGPVKKPKGYDGRARDAKGDGKNGS